MQITAGMVTRYAGPLKSYVSQVADSTAITGFNNIVDRATVVVVAPIMAKVAPCAIPDPDINAAVSTLEIA